GVSLALFGTHLLVGASGDRPSAAEIGRAYLYDLGSPAPLVPRLSLTNPNPAVGHSFGTAVALSGTRAVIAAPWDVALQFGAPGAYVYDFTGATPALPVLTLKNPSPAGSNMFGSAVALSGTRLVIGAEAEKTGDVSAGAAYVYDLAAANPQVAVLTLT